MATSQEILNRFKKLDNVNEGNSADLSGGTYLLEPLAMKMQDSQVAGGQPYFKWTVRVAGVITPIAADVFETPKGEKIKVLASADVGFVGDVLEHVGSKFPGYAMANAKQFITAIETSRGKSAEEIKVFLDGDDTAADKRTGLEKYLDPAWFAKNVADGETYVQLFKQPTPEKGGRLINKNDLSLGKVAHTKNHWSAAV